MINNEFRCKLGKKIIIVLIVILIIIVGYHKLFFGSNFFADEDDISVYRFSEGNVQGNGWRPDVAFGMSFFHAGVGSMHPWSLWSLWAKLFKIKYLDYNLSVLILLIVLAFSTYHFLRTVTSFKEKHCIMLAILAPLISFSSLQHEFYFQRHWICLAIGAPQMLILLYSYFKESRIACLFQGGFILWSIWFLSGEIVVYELIVVCILFSILYYCYYRPGIKDFLLKFTFIHLMELIFVMLLGAWILYSIFIELKTVDYVRDPVYKLMMSNQLFLGAKSFWANIIQSLHAGWFPSDIVFLELPKTLDNLGLRTFSWDNCFIAFPIIFLLFMSKRSLSFWEYILFWLSVIFYLHNFFIHVSPFYYQILCKGILNYPLQKFQPAYHGLQLGMLALFFSNYNSYLCYNKHWVTYIRKVLALVLTLAYCSLIIFAVLIYFFPSTAKGLFVDVDLLQLKKTISFSIIAFYLSSAFITGIFIRDKWIRYLLDKYPISFAILFLMNGIFLSWGVYPMNNRPLVWDIREKQTGNSLSQTSRLFWSQPMSSQSAKFHDFNFRWGINEADPVRHGIGYRNMPGFSVNETKPFTQREVRDFILHSLVKPVGNNPPVLSVRDICGGHYYRAENATAFDMASISHVFTIGESDVPDRLKLLDKTVLRYPWYDTNMSDLCVYKNETAWPYFYLAQWGKVEGGLILFKPKPHDASSIKLREFSYGKLTFEYNGKSENTLIVIDAWHPFWKAYVDKIEIPVFKANGIFKGVKLPDGKHSVVMAFDTSPYRPGIYISIVAWILFLFFWVYFSIHKTVLKF